MAGIKSISEYPWLCNSITKLESPISDGNNLVCSNETDTVNEVVQDAYEKYGIKCVYYRVTEDLLRDKVFGEDQLRMILRSWYFNGYVEQLPPNVRTYQLQGIWGEDIVRMYASIGAFNYYSTYGGTDRNTPEVYEEQPPSIGDIIYIPANNTFYRIVDVKYYEQAFGLAPHTYTFTLKVYKDNKWTISADSPTLSNPEDPIYKVATYPLSSCYQINDPLNNQPVVTYSSWDNPDPYNNVNVLYDPDAHTRNQLKRLEKDIDEAGKSLSAAFTDLYTSAGKTKTEINEYIGKTNDYVSTNNQMISNLNSDVLGTQSVMLGISADAKTIEDLDGNIDLAYYTKE